MRAGSVVNDGPVDRQSRTVTEPQREYERKHPVKEQQKQRTRKNEPER